MKYKEVFENEVPANVVGSGEVQGTGVGEKGEPGFDPRRKKKKDVLRGVISDRGFER